MQDPLLQQVQQQRYSTFTNFNESGFEAIEKGDYKEAKSLLTRAADLANDLSYRETDKELSKLYADNSEKLSELIEEKLAEETSHVKRLLREQKRCFNAALDACSKNDLKTAKAYFEEARLSALTIASVIRDTDFKIRYKNLADEISKVLKTQVLTKTDIEKKFKEVDASAKKTTMKDVIGLDDVKEEVYYKVYRPLMQPNVAQKYKIEPGSKLLLYGPPGTGKTHIARAIAGTIDANFYVINCQDLIGPYLGESSKKIDELFEQIKNDDRAIIFFDEFDSIASKRIAGGDSANGEMARVVTTLLTKIDGFNKDNEGKMLMLVAATNKPWALDPAILRGGRFDTQIYVGTPNYDARRAMIEKAFEGVPVTEDFSVDALAKALDGYGGGDVVSVCEKIRLEAYKKATKNDGEIVKVSAADCKKGLKRQRNAITPEMLREFEEFKNQNGTSARE